MSGVRPGSDPEYEKLLRERELLCSHLTALSVQREECLYIDGPNLEGLYYQKVGHLEVAYLQIELQCARLKREIELITAAVQSGAAWDEITTWLDDEFEIWQQRVAKQVHTLEEARARPVNLIKPEDSDKIRTLYRSLVPQLHPDLQPARHPRLRPLWDRLQRAYRSGDLPEMEHLALLIKDAEPAPPSGSGAELLKEIKSLKTQINRLADALNKIRKAFPFTMADLLNDPVGLAEKQETFAEKLRPLEQRRTALLAQRNNLLNARP